MATPCPAVSHNLCAAISHDPAATFRFLLANPVMKAPRDIQGATAGSSRLRISDNIFVTNQAVSTFQWVPDGLAVAMPNPGYSRHPGKDPGVISFFDIQYRQISHLHSTPP